MFHPTKDLFDRIDGYFTILNQKISVEIKCRDIKYKDYTEHLLEVDKYKALVKEAKYGLYACFFGEDILYLYDVNRVVPLSGIEYKLCAKVSVLPSEKCFK